MKKIIAVMAALAVSSLSAFALDITVGGRGNFNMGLGTSLEGIAKTQMETAKRNTENYGGSWKEGGNMGGGFAVYANFGLLDLGGGSLGIQPEAGINFNNGWNAEVKVPILADADFIFKYNSVDIPVLVTYTFPVMDALSIGGGVGPYLSIPFGMDRITKDNTSGDVDKDSDDYNIKASMNFGLAFDVNGAYKVGPGSIVLDVRYMLDLTKGKITSTRKSDGATSYTDREFLTRRALTIGLGYQMKF